MAGQTYEAPLGEASFGLRADCRQYVQRSIRADTAGAFPESRVIQTDQYDNKAANIIIFCRRSGDTLERILDLGNRRLPAEINGSLCLRPRSGLGRIPWLWGAWGDETLVSMVPSRRVRMRVEI
jgi:hypothetical protein